MSFHPLPQSQQTTGCHVSCASETFFRINVDIELLKFRFYLDHGPQPEASALMGMSLITESTRLFQITTTEAVVPASVSPLL
jgi:hypothetical protein